MKFGYFVVGWLLGSVVLSSLALSRGDNAALQVEGYKVLGMLVLYGTYKAYKFFKHRRSNHG